jgi:hypothetical protein
MQICNATMHDNKIKTTLPTPSTINVGVEQREPPSPHAGDNETLVPEARDESTSIADDESIAENSITNNIAITVHDVILERVTEEATLETVATFDSPPLPLQMFEGQAEDVLLQEKRFKIRGGLEALSDEEPPPLPLPMTFEDDISIQKQKLFSAREKLANQPSNTAEDVESQCPSLDSQHDQRPIDSRPMFFPIEATPVTEKTALNSDRDFRPPSITYAEPIPDESKRKRLAKTAAWSFVIIAVIISVAATAIIIPCARNNGCKGPEPAPPCCPLTSTTFASELDCEVLAAADSSFFESDCQVCIHSTGCDKDTAVITRDREEGQIQFLSNRKGSLVADTQLPRMYIEDIEVSEHVIALSDPWAGKNRSYIGVVYMYERLGGKWLNVVNITPGNITNGAEFGSAISIDKDLMVVSAPADSLHGSVFVYRRVKEGAWIQETKLTVTHNYCSAIRCEFGSAVAVNGRTIVVSDEWVNGDTGAAFVYLFNSTSRSWERFEIISNDDCEDRFGYTIALTKDHSGLLGLLVGCIFTRNETGAVYYYTKNDDNKEFELSQKITEFNGVALPELGGKIFVDEDNFLAIGTGNGNTNGTVFIFTKLGNKWREVVAVDAPDTAQSFGRDTGLSGDNIIISSSDNVHAFKLNKTSCLAKKAGQIHRNETHNGA